MLTVVEDTVAEIEAFCREREISLSDFGQMAGKDRSLVHDLKAGRRSPRVKTLQGLHDWMAEQRQARQ